MVIPLVHPGFSENFWKVALGRGIEPRHKIWVQEWNSRGV